MLLLLPQRDKDHNYLNFIRFVVVCGILQTLLDVVYIDKTGGTGPVVKFSLE
jgi:hypothetical protein